MGGGEFLDQVIDEYEVRRLGGRDAEVRVAAHRRRPGREAGQGAGGRCGWPSRAAPSGRRCSSRWSCSGASGRCGGCEARPGSDWPGEPCRHGARLRGRTDPDATPVGDDPADPGRRRPDGAIAAAAGGAAPGAAGRRCSSSSAVVGYYLVSLYQVWSTGRSDQARPVDAIVVMGAAQYDGDPSPQLAARLDHVAELWPQGLAPLVVVTGGNQPGDRFTEAEASAAYLVERGVPADAIVLEGEPARHVRVDAGRRRPARRAGARRAC